MKILLTCILKDDSELEMARRMLNSFMPHMSGLVVNINGQGPKEKLKALIGDFNGVYIDTNPQTHPKQYLKKDDKYIFADFAEARNISFELAEQEQKKHNYDWWLWADVDDLLVAGKELDEVAERAKEMNLDSVFFTYWYSINIAKDGSFSHNDVNIDHLRERLLKPNTFKWVSRLHEVALPKDDNYKPQHSLYDYNPKEGRNCVWAHVTDGDRVQGALQRNITILEAQAKEEEKRGHRDPRTTMYLAKTYYDLRKPEYDELAETLFNDYLDGPVPSGWREERANACEYLAQIRIRKNDHQGAITYLHRALQEYPNRHMVILLLAQEYAEVGLVEESNYWLDVAMKMEPPSTRTTIGNPLEIKFRAASLKFNQAIKNQDIKEAIYWLEVRNQLSGVEEDPMLDSLQDVYLTNQAATWVFNYAKWLKDKGYTNKIPSLLSSLPIELGREAFAHHIANEVSEPKVWDKDTVVYYASFGGEHFEQWSGKSLERGIGGSETAVIRLAEEWVKLGYKATVFCDPRDEAGVINGVTYRPWYEMNWKDEFNILILWRSPHLLDRDIKARRLFMDLHDMSSALDYNEARVKKLDKVFFKSEYHKKQIPQLGEKGVVISNGI